jgi:hypothetical protein
MMICMYVCIYVCIYGIIWEFICMNEIVKLLECFNMTIIGEYSWKDCDLLSWTCIGEFYVFE